VRVKAWLDDAGQATARASASFPLSAIFILPMNTAIHEAGHAGRDGGQAIVFQGVTIVKTREPMFDSVQPRRVTGSGSRATVAGVTVRESRRRRIRFTRGLIGVKMLRLGVTKSEMFGLRSSNSLINAEGGALLMTWASPKEGSMTLATLKSYVCFFFLLVVLAIFTGVSVRAGDSYTFTAVDVPGAHVTVPFGINDRCQVVGFDRASSTDPDHGFLWSDGRFTPIDVAGSDLTWATGINNRGQIVGPYLVGINEYGFLLSEGVFTTIDIPGGFTEPRGINDRGDIVGRYEGGGFLLHHKGRITILDVPGSSMNSTFPLGVNNAGHVVGFYDDAAGRHGFLFADGIFTTIDAPQPSVTEAIGINDIGDIVGEYDGASGDHHGFIFSKGQFRNIDVNFPGAFGTNVFGVSNSGEVAGEYDLSFEAGFPSHGFVATTTTVAKHDRNREGREHCDHDRD
jgi:probable HAF family extracellular repeat protein